MRDLYNNLNEVNSLVCDEHYASPILKIENGRIILTTCCQHFRLTCYKLIIDKLYQKDDKIILISKSETKVAHHD